MKIMLRRFGVFVFLICIQICIGQESGGYWDNVRITSETFSLKAGEKKVIKTADFPSGTTEVVFRITVLDENQKITNSLTSLLKSIPDPTGISQGSAGAIFLLSTVAGNDKCKYALFSNDNEAENYVSKKPFNACISQNAPINKEAKIISFASNKCIPNNAHNLWFGFESDNWIMNQKILLEVVPWIDKKESSGWNNENKKSVIATCKSSETAKLLVKSDTYCSCVLEKFQKKYSFREYSNLLDIEKKSVWKNFEQDCLIESGEISVLDNLNRKEAAKLASLGKYDEAIKLLNAKILETKRVTIQDYNAIGEYYLLSKQFEKAIKYLKEGEKLDNSELSIQLNLAHAYMFSNDLSAAKEIHKKYKDQNISAKLSWKTKSENDFKLFEILGFSDDSFNKILRLLK